MQHTAVLVYRMTAFLTVQTWRNLAELYWNTVTVPLVCALRKVRDLSKLCKFAQLYQGQLFTTNVCSSSSNLVCSFAFVWINKNIETDASLASNVMYLSNLRVLLKCEIWFCDCDQYMQNILQASCWLHGHLCPNKVYYFTTYIVTVSPDLMDDFFYNLVMLQKFQWIKCACAWCNAGYTQVVQILYLVLCQLSQCACLLVSTSWFLCQLLKFLQNC